MSINHCNCCACENKCENICKIDDKKFSELGIVDNKIKWCDTIDIVCECCYTLNVMVKIPANFVSELQENGKIKFKLYIDGCKCDYIVINNCNIAEDHYLCCNKTIYHKKTINIELKGKICGTYTDPEPDTQLIRATNLNTSRSN